VFTSCHRRNVHRVRPRVEPCGTKRSSCRGKGAYALDRRPQLRGRRGRSRTRLRDCVSL
jgi:hypothetical protein